jgi:hypothetical protein
MRIEAHIKSLPITATIVRPVTFMELLVMPGFGLDEGRFSFFAPPAQRVPYMSHKATAAVDQIETFI